MRHVIAILTFACLSACSAMRTGSEVALTQRDSAWRQEQAARDADAIMQGMAHAREQNAELARSAR